jgi:hypothetical protein
MATPQIPDGRCPFCQAPIIDLFAEWTEEYQTAEGKRAILAGSIVFDCYYCQQPMQLVLPLALIPPGKEPLQYRIAKRDRARCQQWRPASGAVPVRDGHGGLAVWRAMGI